MVLRCPSLLPENALIRICPEYSDGQARANSVGPDKTAQETGMGLHCSLFHYSVFDTSTGIQMDVFYITMVRCSTI